MNIYNNFLLTLMIFCAFVNTSRIKPRKGAELHPISAIAPPSIEETTENTNKTVVGTDGITIKTTLKPKVSNSTDSEVKTHKGREGVVETYHKIEVNQTQNVENQNKTIKPIQITTERSSKISNTNSTVQANVDPSKIKPSNNTTTLKKIGKINVSTVINSTIPVSSNNATNVKSTTTTLKPTTTKSKTTTTTTPKPVKPKFSLSIDDYPSIGSVAKQNSITENSKLPVDEPIAQSSRESESRHFYTNRRHDYFIAIISMIFILPLLMGIIIVAYRKFNEFWSTRHYRRMDFLIEGMYD